MTSLKVRGYNVSQIVGEGQIAQVCKGGQKESDTFIEESHTFIKESHAFIR